ncbi:hypothetical protein [Streptomyces sp. A 4/2]|uniref:hypothetical protein n=1 Tax=Streptomyces sp. A 4/2 TaxID=2934314 RepID=UPI002023ECFD|nr:hypothetical protein [Streptomyces sp. A 4/2]
MPPKHVFSLATVPFCITIGSTVIAVVAIFRADSAAVPDALRAIACLAYVLLCRHHRACASIDTASATAVEVGGVIGIPAGAKGPAGRGA